MAQTDVNRLLILPAIVLAAALSLTGCADLPFFGGDSDSSNNSSSNKDDDDDEDDEDEEEEEDDSSGSSNCPRQFLDATKQQSDNAETGFDEITIREIDPADFEPAVVGTELDGGCIFVIEYVQDDKPGKIFEAFVPGGDELKTTLDAALVADGFDNSTESFYVGTDNEYVIIYGNDEGLFTDEQIEEQGLDFLGDEFLVITAYKGEV